MTETDHLGRSPRCTCGAGHATFGACVRAKNFAIGYCRSHVEKNPAQSDYTANRRHERELSEYYSARMQGIRPGGTTMPAIRHALDRSDQLGKAYNAAQPLGE